MAQRSAFPPSSAYRDFRGRRLLVSVLRMLHLAGMVGVGAGLLAPQRLPSEDAFVIILVGSGAAMLGLDFWANPLYVGQFAGVAIVAKLMLLLWYLLDAAQRPWLFWLILGVSSLAAHAPAWLRHRRVVGGLPGG